MNEKLIDELRRSVHGQSWHGPALLEALDAVHFFDAAAQRLPTVHSVWEIVRHSTSWMEEAADRLAGNFHQNPVSGDWPLIGDVSQENWCATRAALIAAFDRLAAAVAEFPPERLEEKVGDEQMVDDAASAGFTYEQMLHGVAQHNAYHAGQIRLLHRMKVSNRPRLA